MKIVHISTEDYNGAGLCCYRICIAQIALGHDVKMLVFRKPRHNDRFIFRVGKYKYYIYRIFDILKSKMHMRSKEIEEINYLKKQTGKYYSLPTSIIDLTNNCDVKDADVIHLHWCSEFLDYPTFFRKIGNKKTIIMTLHDENLFCGIAHYTSEIIPNCAIEKRYSETKKIALKHTTNVGIVFLSKMMHDKFINNPVIKNCRKTIINNSVDYTKYKPIDKNETRLRYQIPNNTTIFAFCACYIYEKRKGLDVLSKALNNINPNFRIIAIGMDRRTAEMPNYSNVITLGPGSSPSEISAMLSCADYFCMPSYQEAFAQTPIEAMACGLPIIVFPCSGTEEIVNSYTGIRCKDFSQESLELGIREALNTTFSSTTIIDYVKNKFSPEIVAKKYISFYSELIKREPL